MAITRRHLLVAAAAGGGVFSSHLLDQAGRPFNPAATAGIQPVDNDISGLGEADQSDLARLQIADPPVPLPPISFETEAGRPQYLQDVLAQHPNSGVVINFWATWCGPCREELSSLDALAGRLRGKAIPVLALASDQGGAATVRPFFAVRNIRNLAVLLDPGMVAAHQLGTRGIPTTILVDSRGREQARLEGAADWTDAKLIARITQLIGGTLPA